MKKKILIFSILSSVLMADSFIDLKNPDVTDFDKNKIALGTKVRIKTGKDFKNGVIILSLTENKDYRMNNLNKTDFEFFASYFLSNMDSVNSPKIIYYSWKDNKNKKHSKLCGKKKLPVPDVSKMSGCAIQKELGTANVEEYVKNNSFIIECQDLVED